MITTTFATVALSAVLSTAAIETPNWQSDYSKALTAAATQQKPVAVFIGSGEGGFAKVTGGQLPADAGQVLAKSYVCVYVDTDTTAGKTLAGQFELTNGLVISSKGGNVQALRHTGTVAPADLTGYLTKYSEVKSVATTEQGGVVPAGVVVGGCANGRCPTSYTYPAGAVYQGGYAPAYGTFPAYSTCPNGRCPNAR